MDGNNPMKYFIKNLIEFNFQPYKPYWKSWWRKMSHILGFGKYVFLSIFFKTFILFLTICQIYDLFNKNERKISLILIMNKFKEFFTFFMFRAFFIHFHLPITFTNFLIRLYSISYFSVNRIFLFFRFLYE